jgi:predicted lysophospholipase L1 biosynthesis ABC-type transport system permease subunit
VADEWRKHVARLDGRVNTVAAQVEAHIGEEAKRWDKQDEFNNKVEQKVDRPSRFDSLAQALLLALCTGMAVYLFTH